MDVEKCVGHIVYRRETFNKKITTRYTLRDACRTFEENSILLFVETSERLLIATRTNQTTLPAAWTSCKIAYYTTRSYTGCSAPTRTTICVCACYPCCSVGDLNILKYSLIYTADRCVKHYTTLVFHTFI